MKLFIAICLGSFCAAVLLVVAHGRTVRRINYISELISEATPELSGVVEVQKPEESTDDSQDILAQLRVNQEALAITKATLEAERGTEQHQVTYTAEKKNTQVHTQVSIDNHRPVETQEEERMRLLNAGHFNTTPRGQANYVVIANYSFDRNFPMATLARTAVYAPRLLSIMYAPGSGGGMPISIHDLDARVVSTDTIHGGFPVVTIEVYHPMVSPSQFMVSPVMASSVQALEWYFGSARGAANIMSEVISDLGFANDGFHTHASLKQYGSLGYMRGTGYRNVGAITFTSGNGVFISDFNNVYRVGILV